jgi:hypothetical protein
MADALATVAIMITRAWKSIFSVLPVAELMTIARLV